MEKFIISLLLLIPLLTVAQENPARKTAYFFYLDSCPHCHNVDEYFSANGLYDKYDIKKLDASIPANGKFMMDLYAANGYSEDESGGVPVVAFGNKFLVGDRPVAENFIREIEAADNTDRVPEAPADIVAHEGPISASPDGAENASADGNKKSYTPVIIGALVILGAGALIYVNRN